MSNTGAGGFKSTYGTSWEEQWDYGQDLAPTKSKHSSYSSSSGNGTVAKTKKAATAAGEKAKVAASVGFKKAKEGAVIGFHWVKDKYNNMKKK